ncbi:amidohydrolase family protein [Microbacterium invictum]|uniref:Amidohydrolase family protein n=1 Tax=Microbacterium invictum TaxID=515415 RepID=A0ABZ0VCT3_9MICO|nr:amidohydrolase family protein [Microbacterium invictum]WQB70471.1 amidohydrolase family protein [Microbacterium invictum]
MSERRLLLRGASLFTSDDSLGELSSGDVLIVDGVIREVGREIIAPDAEVLPLEGAIVLPGLVDTHRHMWQTALRHVAADWTMSDYVAGMIQGIGPGFTPEDVRIAGLVGSLEALDAGTTTVMDWSHIVHTPAHAEAAIDALHAAGVRAVYGYGLAALPAADWFESDLRRLAGSEHFRRPDGLLSLALASWGPEFADVPTTVRDIELARELGLRTSLHIGVGMMGAARAVTELDARGLLGDDLEFIHATTATDAELARIAQTGGSVSVSPRVEMQMGHGYPATGRMRDAGLRPSLSVDIVSGIPGTLFGEMRAAMEAERARQNAAALSRHEWPGALRLTAHDMVRMATIDGARALGLAEVTGSLTPGKQADIIVLRADTTIAPSADTLASQIVAADAHAVEHVLVAGEFRKRGGRIVGHDLASLRRDLDASRLRLLQAAGALV